MKLIKTNSLKDLKLIANWLDKDDIGMQEMSEYVKTDNWYSLLNKDSRIVYFILNDIENIGFIDLEIVANNKAYFSFYIVPQKRNMGYGQLALKQLIKKSTELGILRLILIVLVAAILIYFIGQFVFIFLGSLYSSIINSAPKTQF